MTFWDRLLAEDAVGVGVHGVGLPRRSETAIEDDGPPIIPEPAVGLPAASAGTEIPYLASARIERIPARTKAIRGGKMEQSPSIRHYTTTRGIVGGGDP